MNHEDVQPTVQHTSTLGEDKKLEDVDDKGAFSQEVVAGYDHPDELDIVPAETELAAKRDLEIDEAVLDELEGKLHSLSLERATAIAAELYKIHQQDQNFPQEALNRLEDFIVNNDHICSDPLKNADIIREVKLECLLATENSPYLEVRANTENTDDPNMPALTFRVWVLSTIFAGIGSFVDTLFAFREPPIFIGTAVGQLLSYPFGKFMAKVLPTFSWTMFGYKMSLNPGPFNRKEHMLITIACNVSLGSPYTTYIVPVQGLPQFFDQKFAYSRGYQFLNTFGTTFVGYGFAGIARRFLVWPSWALWPGTFNNMALIKAFHNEEPDKPVRAPFGRMFSMSREKFFLVTFLMMFVYYWFPGFIFPALSAFSWITWIAPNNANLSTVCGFYAGLGLNPWPTFDWNVASTFITPLTLPTFTVVNLAVGSFIATLSMFGVYYTNTWNTAYFPINSANTFDNTGNPYNISMILDASGNFDEALYQAYSQPWMGAAFAVDYVWYFAMYSATITYIILFHRYEIGLAFAQFWRAVGRSFKRNVNEDALVDLSEDWHYRQMTEHYKDVPEWVYLVVLLGSAAIGMAGVGAYPSDTSPVVIIFGMIMTIITVIPCGIVQAVTGLAVPTNVISEFIGGLLVSGDADALMYFKTYGYISCYQALLFSNDLKLAHYTKIPPWNTFVIQMWASLIFCIGSSSVFDFVMGLPGVCTPDAVFDFFCPNQYVYYTASIFWGTLSPKRLFGPGRRYNMWLIAFPVGVAWVVLYWFLRKKFPRNRFLRQIHPVVVTEGPVYVSNPYNIAWFLPAVYITVFSFQFVRKRYNELWAKYNYVLSASFQCGVAIAGVIIFFGLAIPNGGISLDWWGVTVTQQGCEASGGCAILAVPTDPGYFGPAPGDFYY